MIERNLYDSAGGAGVQKDGGALIFCSQLLLRSRVAGRQRCVWQRQRELDWLKWRQQLKSYNL